MPADPIEIAAESNKRLMASVQKRADAQDTVIGPCLADYRARLERGDDEHPLLNLTRHLTGTFDETAASIRARMEDKHSGSDDAAAKIESSVRNSLMRSAGTNYQGLVSYALAAFLHDRKSAWYVEHPVPKDFGYSLSIRFTGGVVGGDVDEEGEGGGQADPDEEPVATVTVAPDVDILIRNAAWEPNPDVPEPVLLLSVKTSLADRAGSAARWKTYFDIVTHPCPHVDEPTCVYRHLGMELAENPNVEITHGIVTANIYKINSDEYYAENGELATGQARANTFMFDLRFSTRNETEKVMAPGWEPLAALPDWLDATSKQRSLPS